jgi:hypothetical protein
MEQGQPLLGPVLGKERVKWMHYALFFNTAFFHSFRMRIRDFHALSREKPYDENGDCLQTSDIILFHQTLSKRALVAVNTVNLPSHTYIPKEMLTYEACPKSIQLYFFPEKPVTAAWQI